MKIKNNSFSIPLGIIIIFLFFQSCAPNVNKTFKDLSQRPNKDVLFFQQLDEETERAERTHVGYAKVPGFPYLRSNRFLAGIKEHLQSDEQKKAWVKALGELDFDAREKEISSLPIKSLRLLAKRLGFSDTVKRSELIQLVKKKSYNLLQHDLKQPSFFPTLFQLVQVPEDYSTAMRGFGFYVAAIGPFAFFADRAYNEMKQRNQVPSEEIIVHGDLETYRLQQRLPFPEIGDLFQDQKRDLLGRFQPTQAEKERLVNFFAPVIQMDRTESYDEMGEISWKDGKIFVDGSHPVLYYYFSHALFQNQPILQINYVLWTAAREGPHSPWIEHGKLDGLTLRISLDSQGTPILIDIMNNCGCYHFFVPHRQRMKSIIPAPFEFDPLVIDFLPEAFPEKAISIRLNAGWHQVEDIGVAPDEKKGKIKTYRLLPYEILEALPQENGETQSMFDMDGIGVGSDRIEPWLFFSMGIPRVGAMRQRGRHPVKMLGKLHFDDPKIIEKSFIYNSP